MREAQTDVKPLNYMALLFAVLIGLSVAYQCNRDVKQINKLEKNE